MVKREELIDFIEAGFGSDFAAYARRRDDYVNGVQLRGRGDVSKVALGVSVSLEFLNRCRAWGADFVVVHHGAWLKCPGHHINPVLKERLRALIDGDMTLLAYHYMLDAHPVFGNNAQIIKLAGAHVAGPFYDGWGFVGEFDKALPLDDVLKKLSAVMKSKPRVYRHGRAKVKRMGVVSGGAAPRLATFDEVFDSGIDLYVTGEVKEDVPQLVKEAKMNFASFGHYNSEVFGVKALGAVIKKQYPKLSVKFVDVPCEL